VAGYYRRPVELPSVDVAGNVLEAEIGKPVAIVVARPADAPARPGVEAETALADHAGAVQLPDVEFAVVVPPQDVRVAVAVEITSADALPVGAGIAETALADHAGSVQFPDISLAVRVLPQDVGKAIVVEIAGAFNVPTRPGIAE